MPQRKIYHLKVAYGYTAESLQRYEAFSFRKIASWHSYDTTIHNGVKSQCTVIDFVLKETKFNISIRNAQDPANFKAIQFVAYKQKMYSARVNQSFVKIRLMDFNCQKEHLKFSSPIISILLFLYSRLICLYLEK